jgi:hypothetical protein
MLHRRGLKKSIDFSKINQLTSEFGTMCSPQVIFDITFNEYKNELKIEKVSRDYVKKLKYLDLTQIPKSSDCLNLQSEIYEI